LNNYRQYHAVHATFICTRIYTCSCSCNYQHQRHWSVPSSSISCRRFRLRPLA